MGKNLLQFQATIILREGGDRPVQRDHHPGRGHQPAAHGGFSY